MLEYITMIQYFVKVSSYYLTYDVDIDIIGRIKWNVTAAFSAIEYDFAHIDLKACEGKTKY